MTAAAAVGGWFYARGQFVAKNTSGEETRAPKSRRSESVFAADSLKGQWTAQVKNATPADFPRLLEEWRTLFPETENGIQGQPEQALRWLYAQWLVRDQEGFLNAVISGDFNWFYPATQVLVQLKPELTVNLLCEGKLKEFGAGDLAFELAAHNPVLYLSLNPDGSTDFSPHSTRSDGDEWETAIRSLAKTNPLAAANAWKTRKLQNDCDLVLGALLPVFTAWRDGDPPIKDWVNRIEDPEIRDLAQHARLMALARKDPHAALTELYSTPLESNNDLRQDAPSVILAELAKQDLPATLRLLKETGPLFHRVDPFAEPTGEQSNPPNPFVAHVNMEDSPEDNGMRSVILNEAANHLPDNPDEMISSLHQLRAEMGGDSPWQREIEAELIRNASGNFSVDSCLAAAKLWDSELNGGRDDDTYQSLAARAAATDPDRAEAALDSLPEAARASFAAEIVKRLPPEETERRLSLLDRLTPEQWDKALGESLGKHAADYADTIADLPGTTTSGAREAFMEKWVQEDPEAANRWFSSLPKDDAAGPAAVGLFKGWSDFDKTAAVAWAETLPNGPARQAVALDVVLAIAAGNPGEAWHWAASITNPKARAQAYNVISVSRDDEPEAFKKEHAAALRAAGME